MALSYSKNQSFKLFDDIAGRYDFINSVLSMGLHYRWRNLIRATLPRRNNLKVLDLATGTADVAIELVKSPSVKKVDGLDMSVGMIGMGREKLKKKRLDQKIKLEVGDAQELPWADNTYDAVTISFGIRNIPDFEKCLRECYRVLKPGGRVIVLEFALPESKIVRSGHLFYLRRILPKIGKVLSGNNVAYTYLNETIEEFPYGQQFVQAMRRSGFESTRYEDLTMGIVNIYWGDKH
ncbi:MAG: bifunctional demethylmenaquinone methyltransferase/2-methoxy-6-polyprenyl-1,4-benzoquinol methylase UbiE [Pseudobacteriovorax sp.]|nr:bifunctional demethylmenaquinone methyltransferase/2-methoxy-6-polyprenyl-1,4-benzoquinol methylase UbiE [Pseudobacteriovorax sp.]